MSDKDNPFGSTPPEDPFGSGSSPGGDPFGGSSADFGSPTPPTPNEGWRESEPRDPFNAPPHEGSRPRADGAIAALVLGVLGLVICPLCAPFAWVLGRRAEQAVDASGGRLSGRSEATAGKILGMVACGLTVVLIVLFLVLGLVSAGGGSAPPAVTVSAPAAPSP